MAFRRKYSAEQNMAVVAGVLDDGLTPAEVAARAAAGELYGLEPFTMPTATVKDKAGDARRERETRELAAADGDAALGAIGARVVALLAREAERLERAARHGRARPEEIGALARATREVGAMRRELERAKPRPARGGAESAPASSDAAPADAGWLAGVAASS